MGRFTVHFLDDSLASASVAEAYSQGVPGPHPLILERLQKPTINPTAIFHCVQHRVIEVGDHEIWIGRVLTTEILRRTASGLLHCHKKYRRSVDVHRAERSA